MRIQQKLTNTAEADGYSRSYQQRAEVAAASRSSLTGIMMIMGVMISKAEAKTPKAKFYDFSEQLIDGDIKKPTALYTDARQQVKFERLLKLKKSFNYLL